MSECIFCMIARGEIPARVVLEGDELLAFDDVAPQAPVHTLIIPKQHYASIADNVPAEMLGRLLQMANRVAEAKGILGTGYRVIVNTGPDAGQTVHHLHVHVLGGRPMSEGMIRFTEGE